MWAAQHCSILLNGRLMIFCREDNESGACWQQNVTSNTKLVTCSYPSNEKIAQHKEKITPIIAAINNTKHVTLATFAAIIHRRDVLLPAERCKRVNKNRKYGLCFSEICNSE